MEHTISSLALVVGVAAAIVSGLSWRAAVQATRASIFEQRFAVYRDAESFIQHWAQKGRPDLEGHLRILVDAWNRSHFLFDREVTTYLRELWLDAIKAEAAQRVVAGEEDGDRSKAIEDKYALINRHCAEESPLRKVFIRHMKI